MTKSSVSLAPDEVTDPQGGTMKKIDRYHWDSPDKPGSFQWISKSDIGVDHSYQREEISESRINRIAHRFRWRKFGCLQVVKHERDGKTYWCFDGQHRLLAVLKRSDIDKVPCMVFKATDVVDEADAFLGSNGDRGSVRTMGKFKALLTSLDPTALRVQQAVTASGYKIATSSAKRTVRCIGALYRAFEGNEKAALVAWNLCVALYRGESPIDRVFMGLWALEHAMSKDGAASLADLDNQKAIAKAGPEKLNDEITTLIAVAHKSGQKVFGAAIASVINKGRRENKKVPTLVGS